MTTYKEICIIDPVTGFERILLVQNEYGFTWFLVVSCSIEVAKKKADIIINDLINNNRSKYAFVSPLIL